MYLVHHASLCRLLGVYDPLYTAVHSMTYLESDVMRYRIKQREIYMPWSQGMYQTCFAWGAVARLQGLPILLIRPRTECVSFDV